MSREELAKLEAMSLLAGLKIYEYWTEATEPSAIAPPPTLGMLQFRSFDPPRYEWTMPGTVSYEACVQVIQEWLTDRKAFMARRAPPRRGIR